MSSAAPTIPPRPSRSGASSLRTEVPQIPPRPHRRSEQSQSPHREAYTRSPLNDHPLSPRHAPIYAHNNISVSDLEDRPPSVSLPGIGQEGDEYASLERTTSALSAASGRSIEQHRSVATDLPMHQPTASVPQITAKERIQGVTRTDSSQAAAAGLGKPRQHDDQEHPLKAKASFNRSTPSLMVNSRPESINDADHIGIPEIGVQVPMYPNAGDVQAPSPAPTQAPHQAGIGFFNDGSQRNHHRRRSSRHQFNPPGSYGMHGHGVEPKDQFEKAWYQRHPEELEKEIHHVYDPGHPRGEWALSSEQLNKLVHGSVNRGLGPSNTSSNQVSTPDEQSGYQASERYQSHGTSPKPTPLSNLAKRPSSGSHPHVESPLRKASFPFNEARDSHALESEDEEGTARDTPSAAKTDRSTSGGLEVPSEDAGAHGHVDEHGRYIYDVPILAADEVAKYPEERQQHPAVDFEHDNRLDDGYHSAYDSDRPSSQRANRRSGSHLSNSRPGSAHGEPLSRFISNDRYESGVGTPLDEIQEYEPLFPDDDGKPQQWKKKALRPDLARHHFPSQDVWEDNPDSLGLTATVSTPDLPLEPSEETEQPAAKTFEHPDKEANRKNGPIASDRAHFLPKETEKLANPHFKPGVLKDIPSRPGLQPRFPSQDIWEDTPDSMRLETTVDTPQGEEAPGFADTPQKPTVPARPAARTQAISPEDIVADDQSSPTADRAKPSVPARPAAKGISATGAGDATTVKAKPAVPSRPAGKFASIKASFMNDLNSRLQLGPQAPKKEEPKEEEPVEAAPLADARKSRARGPARRKPATATETSTADASSSTLSFLAPRHVFSLNESGDLVHHSPSSATSIVPESEAETRSAVPAPSVGAEGDLPDPSISSGTLESQKPIEAGLHEALSSTPSHHTSTTAPTTSSTSATTKDMRTSMTESETQTGQQDITITGPKGEKETLTAYLGGQAPDEGNVVVKSDGSEELGPVTHETPRKIGETGHGM